VGGREQAVVVMRQGELAADTTRLGAYRWLEAKAPCHVPTRCSVLSTFIAHRPHLLTDVTSK
jgi:hypothetical protein